MSKVSSMIDRYLRQTLFPSIGKKGQVRLGSSYVAVIGCGAVGAVIASSLVRAGVGRVRIIDRGSIEYHNLQQQVLFDEDDVRNQLPKAIAAERHLKKVNSSVEIEGIVAHVNNTNIEGLISGADLILDGLDNLETRFLINDFSLAHKIPWVYGEAVASRGTTMSIIPGETPCYQCVFASPFSHGTTLTSDISGGIGPVPFIIGSLESVEAMKILVGDKGINLDRIVIDAWKGTFHRLKIGSRRDCPACHGKFEFLEDESLTKATQLCDGGEAVMVLSLNARRISLEGLAARLRSVGEVSYSEFMLRFKVNTHEMVIFPDGRAIVKNTNDESLALGLYTKYIGA